MKYGYARAGTEGQYTALWLTALKKMEFHRSWNVRQPRPANNS